MDSITFCIPYYGKEIDNIDVLNACIQQLKRYYPDNRIIICKTSDSYYTTYENVEIYDTFSDGSHIIGAIELLVRICETANFIIFHDSMFLLKMLPISIIDKPIYSLWSFKEKSCYFYSHEIQPFIKNLNIQAEDYEKIHKLLSSDPQREWNGIFGPAFGGRIEILRNIWSVLNVNNITVTPYLGRHGLMASERILAIICIYMGFNTEQSLNGNIYDHPNVFNENIIPDFKNISYNSYFYKIWKKR